MIVSKCCRGHIFNCHTESGGYHACDDCGLPCDTLNLNNNIKEDTHDPLARDSGCLEAASYTS